MKPDEFEQNLMRLQLEIQPFLGRYLDIARTRISGTAKQEYMADGGFTSPPFPPRESVSGPLRVLSGRLARSLTGARSFNGGGNANSENISKVESTKEGVKLTYGSNVPYARVHEEGINETVNIPAHTRTITQAFGQPIEEQTVKVEQHRRHMKIPARPYLGPAADDNRQWLADKLQEEFQDLTLSILK
jgi:phage gpG-like protein